MSQLRPAHLGPIVGHTTAHSAKIWIRGSVGDDASEIDGSRRAVGVIAITKEGRRAPRRPRVYYFRLRREYDRTGVFNLGEELGLFSKQSQAVRLQPNTDYVVRVATLFVDDPTPEADSLSHAELAKRLPDPAVWYADLKSLEAEDCEAQFRTFPPEEHEAGISLILGSCRYPGILWKEKHSDAIFGPLLKEAQGRDDRGPVNMALMVGDQIYADMLTRHIPIGLADTFEEFQTRYHDAFGSRHMRHLLRKLSTYMILDDHEIEDNWTQDRIKHAASRRVFNLAIDAYRSYQWVHGPRSFGERLYYQFNCGRFPFFVLDTRTQRFMDDVKDSLNDNHLLGRPSLADDEPSQLDLLLTWMDQAQARFGDVPKFIVSSGVFVPNPIDARQGRKGSEEDLVRWAEGTDTWPAFPTTRKAVLRKLVDARVQNVIFLSGDVHCSNVAEMRFSGVAGSDSLKAFSVTSSAFYWPFPFADGDPSGFVHDSMAQDQEDSFAFDTQAGECYMDYRARNFTQEDNFCRVDIDQATRQLRVIAFGKKGQILETGGWFGRTGKPLEAQLELAPW